MRRFRVILSNAFFAVVLFGTTTNAIAKEFISTNESLLKGDALFSENGEYRFAFQHDGNLVVYNSQNKALWHSATHGSSNAASLIMQGDGNLVLYTNSSAALWHTKTYTPNHVGDYELVMQNDGNLVLYEFRLHFDGTTNVIPLWDSQGHTR